MLIQLAWRNIWRNRSRSLIIIGAVSCGLWAGLFLMGLTTGMVEQKVQLVIHDELSHIQVHHPEFSDEEDVRYQLSDADSLEASVRANPAVAAVTGRIVTNGMLSNASGSAGVKLIGVDPESEQEITGLPDKLVEGEYFGAKRNTILIGAKLAKKLRVRKGGKVVISFQDAQGGIASGAFRVAGIYQTVSDPYDERTVFLRREDFRPLAGIDGVSEIAVLLKRSDQLEAVAQELRSAMPSNKVETWKQLSPEMELIVSASDSSTIIYLSILFIALAFGIINTMLMAVLERTREIGMCIALGMQRARVFMLIVWETVFLVAAGLPTGLFLGLGTIAWLHKNGLNLTFYAEVYRSFGYASIIYPTINLRQVGVTIVLVACTALLSAIFPARKAFRLEPTEAIRR